MRTSKQRKLYKGFGNGGSKRGGFEEGQSKSLRKGSLFEPSKMPFRKRLFLMCSKLQLRRDDKSRGSF